MIRYLLAIGAASVPSLAFAAGLSCEDLAKSGLLTDTKVDTATLLPAQGAMPAQCKVAGTIKPTPGSTIGVEYRLPVPEKWNGKFLGLGGGGFGGVIREAQWAEGLSKGYAAAQTDIGHKETKGPGDASWAMKDGKPDDDAVTDYAWRSVVLMTSVGKELVEKYYGQKPKLSYWQGCSTGGRQGLVFAQRYPEVYDGIIAGAPVYTSRLQLGGIVRTNTLMSRPNSAFTKDALPVVNNAVLGACDAQDGLKDGYLTDPTQCRFDPKQLVCKAGESGNCLNADQAAALETIYAGSPIYPGTMKGGELDWAGRYARIAHGGIGDGMAKYMVFYDPKYDSTKFDIAKDLETWDRAPVSVEGNAGNPEISAFTKRGGKLLLWHGFNDPGPSPLSTVDYYKKVEEFLGAKSRNSVRLFMVPGMYHCRGGPGPTQFDAIAALEAWVEKGVAPQSIPAANKERGISRPLCPYPQVARYKGTGDPNDKANFSCVPAGAESAARSE
jgi:feruloyl esterase